MRPLSCLSCGLCGTSHPQLASPQLRTLPQTVSEVPADEPPAIGLRLVKTLPSFSCRPIEDEFPKTNRSQSFPSTLGLLNKLGWVQATTELRIKTRDSSNSNEMETPYALLSRLICTEVDQRIDEKDQPWLFLGLGKELVKNADVEEVMKDRVEWKDNAASLTTFVQKSAPQLFAMIVYTKNWALLKEFCDKKMGDGSFPVKVVPKRSIESTKEIPPKTLYLGTRFDADARSLFEYWQYYFFFPELCWSSNFESPPLGPNCHLPFLAPLKEVHRSDFSIVYKGVVDRDHIAFDSNDFVSTQALVFSLLDAPHHGLLRALKNPVASTC
jgi:hypothetical protein